MLVSFALMQSPVNKTFSMLFIDHVLIGRLPTMLTEETIEALPLTSRRQQKVTEGK